jgi:hypothetical protein
MEFVARIIGFFINKMSILNKIQRSKYRFMFPIIVGLVVWMPVMYFSRYFIDDKIISFSEIMQEFLTLGVSTISFLSIFFVIYPNKEKITKKHVQIAYFVAISYLLVLVPLFKFVFLKSWIGAVVINAFWFCVLLYSITYIYFYQKKN